MKDKIFKDVSENTLKIPGTHKVKCNKCGGNGSTYHSHSHHVHGNSHAVADVCTKCGGAGKLDWITNAMESIDKNVINIASLPAHTHGNLAAPSTIEFYSGDGTEMLSIKDDGFYVKGKKVVNDLDIYNEFKAFLKQAGVSC